jgi:hypothetical protein
MKKRKRKNMEGMNQAGYIVCIFAREQIKGVAL